MFLSSQNENKSKEYPRIKKFISHRTENFDVALRNVTEEFGVSHN